MNLFMTKPCSKLTEASALLIPGSRSRVYFFAALTVLCARCSRPHSPPAESETVAQTVANANANADAKQSTESMGETSSGEARFAIRAQALTNAVAAQLQTTLMAALNKDGPVKAMSLCSEDAPKITAAAAEKARGLAIRRIGTKVRNQETNRPTPAESDVMATLSSESPTRTTRIDGKLTYMRAIYINSPGCLQCHGSPTEISKEVQAELNKRYPKDEAVGYKVGDLRGAFVVTTR